MAHRYFTITTYLIALLAFVCASQTFAQRQKVDTFGQLLEEIQNDVMLLPEEGYAVPDRESLSEFSRAVNLLSQGSADSARAIFRKFNYTLDRLDDIRTGASYDVIRERRPVRHGWGTYIYNDHNTKRINIHVDHPADDANALTIGTDMFRTMHAAWLLVSGTSKRATTDRISADMARAQQSVFQRVHETIAERAQLSLSIHSYHKKYYQYPVNTTDIVLSNGTTADEQWGISQISIAYRDSLRKGGYESAVAMYDSGFGALSANANPQGIYANERLGFGHWINIELSNSLREVQPDVQKFILLTDRALDFSDKKIAAQLNRSFGLVSPRVVRIDSAHPIMFPSPGQQSYRIISFNATKAHNDTLNVHVGSWLNMFNGDRTMASIQSIDSSGGVIHEFRRTKMKSSRNVLASIVEHGDELTKGSQRTGNESGNDSSSADADAAEGFEPIQVHRIPLQPMVLTSGITQGEITTTSYKWNGVLQSGFSASVPVYKMTEGRPVISDADMLPSFLIPIMSKSYGNAEGRFVGVQMTKVLVEEIARLVTETDRLQKDVSLMAEENENGEYYIRIFPVTANVELADMKELR